MGGYTSPEPANAFLHIFGQIYRNQNNIAYFSITLYTFARFKLWQ